MLVRIINFFVSWSDQGAVIIQNFTVCACFIPTCITCKIDYQSFEGHSLAHHNFWHLIQHGTIATRASARATILWKYSFLYKLVIGLHKKKHKIQNFLDWISQHSYCLYLFWACEVNPFIKCSLEAGFFFTSFDLDVSDWLWEEVWIKLSEICLIKFDPFCLHWSCYTSSGHVAGKLPFACCVTSRGWATPMQEKWI